jgi:hypothetical protein
VVSGGQTAAHAPEHALWFAGSFSNRYSVRPWGVDEHASKTGVANRHDGSGWARGCRWGSGCGCGGGLRRGLRLSLCSGSLSSCSLSSLMGCLGAQSGCSLQLAAVSGGDAGPASIGGECRSPRERRVNSFGRRCGGCCARPARLRSCRARGATAGYEYPERERNDDPLARRPSWGAAGEPWCGIGFAGLVHE